MIFGKRGRAAGGQAAGAQAMQQHAPQQQVTPPQVTQQQAPQQVRVLPAELWDDGPVGKLLRDLGMSPDDEANLVPTGASIDARVARDRAKHEAKLAEINRDVAQRTGGGPVMPFFLIPEPCWNGDMGTFFMARLRFFPFDDWNVLFLPADERTAKIMNAPLCPYGEIPGAVDLVQAFVRESEAKLAAVHAEVDRTRNFAALAEAVDSVRAEVWGIAAYIANHIGAKWDPPKSWKP